MKSLILSILLLAGSLCAQERFNGVDAPETTPSAVAFGDISGQSGVQKFGNAPDFDTGDGRVTIWDGADDGDIDNMQYIYCTTACVDSVISSSANDIGTVEVQGLGAGTNMVVQSVTLTGTNRVALTTPLLRVFRVKNTSATNWVGDVSCYVTNAPTLGGIPTDTSLIRAHVVAENNQTEMGVFTVPYGEKVLIKRVYFWSSGAKKSAVYECSFWARSPGGIFRLQWKGAFDDDLESGVTQPYELGLVYSAGTDLEARVKILTAAVTEATISAGFEIERKKY